MNYIRQLIYDMRHQKMMTWVSIAGTAVSIFLVLVFFMVNNLSEVEVTPESKRHLVYRSAQLGVRVTGGEKSGWSASGGMTYDIAQKLYGDLEGVELTSYIMSGPAPLDIMVEDKIPLSTVGRFVDGNFWKIFDFNFITGRPFREDEVLTTTTPPAVITEKVARRLFGTTDVLDQGINIMGRLYRIVGLVEDVNPILRLSWGDIYLPLDNSFRGSQFDEDVFSPIGGVDVLLLYKEDTDKTAVENQVKSRMATLNSTFKDRDIELHHFNDKIIHTPEEAGSIQRWNQSPNVTKIAEKQWLVYLFLLLLPAINLSSMMRGRLQHRISEIGVRRAYGARRSDIISQLFGENLVVTIVGGVIGLLLSYLFMAFLSSSFISMVDSWTARGNLEVKLATPSFQMLFTWKAFVLSLGACLVLNILTASIPAWRASSIEPADAISKSRN